MKAWTLFFALLLALVSSAAAQTMYRNIAYGDSCRTVMEKLEGYDDFKMADMDRPCTAYSYASRYAVSGWLDYLFGQREVFASFWFERGGDELQEVTLSVSGIDGLDFIRAAIEGFTDQRGEPEFRHLVDPYEMVSRGSERTEDVARWPGDDGIAITVEAYANPMWRMFSGRVRVAYEKPVTLTTPAQDAGQF